MALTSDPKSTPILLIVLGLAVGYIGYSGTAIDTLGIKGVEQRKAEIQMKQDSLTKLQSQIDSAKRELARGSIDDVRRRLESDRASLGLLRRLVPESNEVPNLLDDITQRAKIRGVSLSQMVPMPLQPGPSPFSTYKYQMAVVGHYDQIGQFLADMASLQRIIVPDNLTIAPANQQAQRVARDTTGALLEAKFQIRTYVKSGSAEAEGSSGT